VEQFVARRGPGESDGQGAFGGTTRARGVSLAPGLGWGSILGARFGSALRVGDRNGVKGAPSRDDPGPPPPTRRRILSRLRRA